MKVAELVELLKTMPQDADVATVTKLGNGMFSAICNAIKYDGHDAFGDYTMVILENGTYPTILPNKVNHTPGILERALEQVEEVLPGFEDEPKGIPGKDFVPVDWVETLEMYGKWKIVKV